MSTNAKTAKKTEKDKPKVAKSKALKPKALKPKPLKESANDSIQSFLDTLDGEPVSYTHLTLPTTERV